MAGHLASQPAKQPSHRPGRACEEVKREVGIHRQKDADRGARDEGADGGGGPHRLEARVAVPGPHAAGLPASRGPAPGAADGAGEGPGEGRHGGGFVGGG